MGVTDKVWQTADLSQTYLEGVRGAVPLAGEQIDIILRLIQGACPQVKAILDVGCGDGILGQAVLDHYPAAHGVFVDFSQPMLAAAHKRLSGYPHVSLLQLDYGQKEWQTKLPLSTFDVIVSGFSIHHQPDERKREIYAELYHLLTPGGIFLNLEHVASQTRWGEAQFESFFLDALYQFHQQTGAAKSRAEIDQEYYSRPDKAANQLALVETQCEWLRQIGFVHVDCFFKLFELAIFGGIRPD